MDFDPKNPVVQLCLQGINLEENKQPGEALKVFLMAWNDSNTDFEKYLSAYFVARHQETTTEKVKWIRTALDFASKVNNDAVKGAFPSMYLKLAQSYEEIGETDNAKKYYDLAEKTANEITDKGPFYHGTRADLKVGDLLTPGGRSNYKAEVIMNHIYFTAVINGAGLAAALAQGEGPQRVYIVEPTGNFENDPNVTDKKFLGNPTRSYRTKSPLRIIGEIRDWEKLTPEDIQKWKDKLANVKGDIIN